MTTPSDTPDMPADMPETGPDIGPKPGTELSAADVAAALAVNERTVRRWINRGELTARKVGSHYVIPAAELDRLRAERTNGTPASEREPADTAAGHARGHTQNVSDSRHRPADMPVIDLQPLADLIERQQEELQRLTEAATAWQFRALRAEEQLQQLQAGPIAAPVPATEVQADAAPTQSTAESATQAPGRRPRWRFWEKG